MNKISCDICMDLIPLVKDEVASEDSYNAVLAHISNCNECKLYFDKEVVVTEEMNDKKIISKIKKQLGLIALMLIVIGSFIGVAFSETELMFYNVLIMPTIGLLGYFIFKNKSYILLIGVFVLVYIYHLIKYIISGTFNNQIISYITSPGMWALMYSGFCGLGILIGFLLYIAFKREE